jgi:hypothetical protein
MWAIDVYIKKFKLILQIVFQNLIRDILANTGAELSEFV